MRVDDSCETSREFYTTHEKINSLDYFKMSRHKTHYQVCDKLTLGGAKALTFRHRASSMQDRRFATLQKTLFYILNQQIYLFI